MAKTMTIGTKVDSETHEKLTKLATTMGVSISELVRELIEAGISEQEKPAKEAIPEDLSKRLDALTLMAFKATRAAAKAQFLASMSVGFTSDLAKLIVSGKMPTTDEKTEFLGQTNDWAEGFAKTYLQEDNSELLSKNSPHPQP